jgi:hypothetical protein
VSEIVDDPNPEIKDCTERLEIEIDEEHISFITNLFVREGIIQERERIATWIKAHRTEVTDGVFRDHFNSEYLLNNVIPLPEVESED